MTINDVTGKPKSLVHQKEHEELFMLAASDGIARGLMEIYLYKISNVYE